MAVKRKRLVAYATIAVLLMAVLWWAFRPRPVPADFATAQRGRLEVTINEEAETRVRDRFVVSAPLPGRMQRIELEPGDPVVAQKTVVAMFQPADPALLDVRTRTELAARVKAAETSVGGARAELKRVQTELAFARSELKRYQELATQGIASKERLESAERQARILEEAQRSAEFAVRTAEHQLQVAQASLLQAQGVDGRPGPSMTLKSPVDGVVLRRLKESEAVVMTGAPLVEIGNLGNLEIVSDLLSTDAVRVRPGYRVLIEEWGGDKPLHGRVRRVEPSGFTKISALGVEEQRVNVIIDVDDPKTVARQLGDGYRVEVRIIIWERDDVVKVPTSSLFRHDNKWAVFQVREGRATRTVVEIGQQNGLEAEVMSGLRPGDQVIIYPSDAIAEGVEVTSR